jgi:hypothetical protein
MNITFIGVDNKTYTFLHIPKVAGRSITSYIMTYAKSYHTNHENSHATLAELRSLNIDLGTTIAIFRNPYARTVSLYNFLFKNDLAAFVKESVDYFNVSPDVKWFNRVRADYADLSFIDFCKQIDDMPLKTPQCHFHPVDIALKVENLSNDIKILQNILGTTDPLPFLNKSKDTRWQEYYANDIKTANTIYTYYKKDFKRLGYSKHINKTSI